LDFDDRGRSFPRKEAPRSPISSDEHKRPRLSYPNAASPEEKTRVPPPPTRPRRRGVRTGPTRRGAPGRKLGRKRGRRPGNVIDRGRDQNSPQDDEERPRRRSRTRRESPVDGGRQPITPVERPTAPINKALPSVSDQRKRELYRSRDHLFVMTIGRSITSYSFLMYTANTFTKADPSSPEEGWPVEVGGGH
jgi:hypothetical protein